MGFIILGYLYFKEDWCFIFMENKIILNVFS